MIKILEELNNKTLYLENQDLVYGAYLCEKLIHKLNELYINQNLEDDYEDIDKLMLSEEFRDLIDNEHLNDCNYIF